MNEIKSLKKVDQRSCEEKQSVPWCAGCGIGAVANAFVDAVRESKLNDDPFIYTGNGCASRIPEVLNLEHRMVGDSLFIDAIIGDREKEKENKRRAVVFLDNADIMLSALSDWHDLQECANILIIHVNNSMFVESANSYFANTPFIRRSARHGDLPFNVPALAISCGACFVARWTPFRVGWLKYSMIDALAKRGFSYIEVLTPCVIFQPQSNMLRSAAERMAFYQNITEFTDNDNAVRLDIRGKSKIAIGTFVDK